MSWGALQLPFEKRGMRVKKGKEAGGALMVED